MSILYETYLKALSPLSKPTLFLDLEALQENLTWIKENAGDKKIRIATKSIRSRAVLEKILKFDPIFQGLMTYDLREALWLRNEGFQDILMGYPTMDLESLEKLAESPMGITLMVDLPEHLIFLEEIAKRLHCKFSICLDIDLSLDLPGLRFGVFRSFVNSTSRLQLFLRTLENCPHLKLTGLMGYEAQIAGVMDKNSFLIRFLKRISISRLQKRRMFFFDMIVAAGHSLSFINGGGTGSLSSTKKEACVSEVTVGSGFFAPVLFDHYKDFQLTPALAFTLPITRNPESQIFTCSGGGYIASGATEAIKAPTPYLPVGVKLLKHEGAGEVQTPVKYQGELDLKIGDSIIFRHAKSGEICERFEEILCLNSGAMIERIKTYRGEGKTFL